MTAFATILIREDTKNKGINTKVVENVRKVKGVVDCFPVTGRADVVAFIEGSSLETVRTAALKVNEVPNVRATETLLSITT